MKMPIKSQIKNKGRTGDTQKKKRIKKRIINETRISKVKLNVPPINNI